MHLASPLLLAAIISNVFAAPAISNAFPAMLDIRAPKKFMGWKVGSSSSGEVAAKVKRSGTHFDFRGKRSITKRETYQADLDYLSELQNSTNAEFLTRLDAAGGTCNSTNIAKRQEYGSLTAAQQIAYTNAVLCLQNKTANTPISLVPGVRTRYDDFVATRKFIFSLERLFLTRSQTLIKPWTSISLGKLRETICGLDLIYKLTISRTFLGWHRHFTWVYEQALRNECGYEGYQPYFNWPLWAESPQTSPLFDGSNTSLSGNGEYIEGHEGTILSATGTSEQDITIQLEPGLGGGCVTSGPFKDMVVNLGPISEWNFTDNAAATEDADGGFAYNPRCLKRDIGGNTAMLFTVRLTAHSFPKPTNQLLTSYRTPLQ